MLPTAKLGKQGPDVTRLGYGAMGLSAFYGKVKSDEDRFAVLDKVYEEGCRFWDTADCYMDSEDLLGNWFKRNPDKRQHIFLATKFGFRFDDQGNMSIDGSPKYVREACEKSLSRLGVSHIDLFYAHRVDRSIPMEKTMEALRALKREGEIKNIGLSECSADTLRRACKIEHVDAVQVEYSPFFLDIESERTGVLKAARELGVAIVAYSPLGRGMLSGQLRSPDDIAEDDARKGSPRFSAESFHKNIELVDVVCGMAKAKNVTPSQLTLAWLMSQGDDIFPIPGTTNVERVAENVGAAYVELSRQEEQKIRAFCEAAEVAGDRYPESFAAECFSDTPPLDAAAR